MANNPTDPHLNALAAAANAFAQQQFDPGVIANALYGPKVTFHVGTDSRGEYRWALKSIGNGRTIADSGEGYRNRVDCLHAIELIKKWASTAEVIG